MNTKLLKRFGMWALALSVVMVGCDSVKESALVGPGSSSEILIIDRDENGYTTATETDPLVGVVTAIIDSNGGELNIGPHRLLVPAGAVRFPTTFVMSKLPGQIEVGLTATRLLPNDAGRAGFLKPVRLTLSYENAANVTDTAEPELEILWKKADGTYEPQQSYVDQAGDEVVANLNHLSIYTLGWGGE
jgi:hypothetical protein